MAALYMDKHASNGCRMSKQEDFNELVRTKFVFAMNVQHARTSLSSDLFIHSNTIRRLAKVK